MALKSASDLVARLRAVEKTMSAAEQRKRLRTVATAVKPLATKAAVADLGANAAFDHWHKRGGGDVIPLTVRFTMHGGNRPSLTMHRDGKSAGPWRVAEQGRNQGNVAGFAGPGINHRTGVTARTKSGNLRKTRITKARRWNGRTDGKDTWSDAIKLMEPKAREMFVELTRKDVARAAVGSLL